MKSMTKNERSRKMKSTIPPFWLGGIQRTIKTLGMVTGSSILKIGKTYEERDQGELAIRKYYEFMDRAVSLRKYPEKLKLSCPNDSCTYRCTT